MFVIYNIEPSYKRYYVDGNKFTENLYKEHKFDTREEAIKQCEVLQNRYGLDFQIEKVD